ncbi:MAG: histidinol-phosphatase HisJ family protein [Bacillota bacterium]
MIVRTDTHTHSLDFSGDAVSYMEEMCRAAVAKGLKRICFTEHVDFDPHYDDSIPFDPERYRRFIETMRDKFGGEIEILKGIEVGEPHVYPKEYEAVLKADDYDMVIASVHYVILPLGLHWTGHRGEDIFTYAVPRIYRRYYEDILAVAKLGGFDVLGHFDYPKRYLNIDAEEDELFEESLRALLKNGGILEINTSPLRKGCGETAPGRKILDLYRSLGGSRLTVGSDAHEVRDIAADFSAGFAMAEGFETGYFRQRRFVPFGDDE